MKLTFILLIVGVLQLSANVYSQNGRMNVQVSEMELYDLLWELQQNTDVVFVYRTNDLEGFEKVTLEREDASLTEILDEVLANTDLEYKFDEDVVVISKKPEEVVVPVNGEEQEQEKKEVKGKVTDKQGSPLPGVSVIIKGTNIGVATNINGHYQMNIPADAKVLVFSFVGMIPQEYAYTGQKEINVVLEEDSKQMSEVVVTGYSSISRERATGSFVKIDEQALEQVNHTDLTEKLKAIAPGVLFTKVPANGGEEIVLQVRGQSTLKANSTPLIVIDGFPVATKLNELNPDDIASINVLQDAAAASIWGAQAANGVIVISTKKGSKGSKMHVEFSYNKIISSKPDLGDLDLASSSEIIDAQIENYEKGLNASTQAKRFRGSDILLSPVHELYYKAENDPSFTNDMRDAEIAKLREINMLDQYADLFLRTGQSDKYNLSLRGGNKNNSYYFSVGHNRSKAISVGDEVQRTNITANNDFQLTNKLKLTTGISLFHQKSKLNGYGISLLTDHLQSNAIPVYQMIQDADGNPIYHYNYNKGLTGVETMTRMEGEGLNSFKSNAKELMKGNDHVNTNRNARVNFGLTYDLTSDLSVSTKFVYDYSIRKSRKYLDRKSDEAKLRYNDFAYYNPAKGGKLDNYLPYYSSLSTNDTEIKNMTWRSQLDYNKVIGKHTINALAGFEMREDFRKTKDRGELGYDDQTGSSLLLDYYQLRNVNKNWAGNALVVPYSARVTEYTSRFVSYYSNLAYTYNNKYTATASARIDDGSMFGVEANKRRTPLWSVGGSWLISREDFFDVSYIDMLKLRLTYGKNGNVSNAHSAFTTLQFWGANWDTNLPQYGIKNRKNVDLKWETTATTNIGIDYALFNHKISGTLEAYYKKTTDLLTNRAINPTFGAATTTLNEGTIVNKGFTFTLGASVGKGLVWRPQVNISYNKNEITNIDLPDASLITILNYLESGDYKMDGHSVSSIWGFKNAGLDENGYARAYDENGNIVGKNDPAISSRDALYKIGDTAPKFWGAFTNSFSYKGFTLYALISYKFGHKFTDFSGYYSSVSDGVAHKSITQRWQKPGDEKFTKAPVWYQAGWGDISNDYYMKSDAVYHDASFIRLQDVALTYDFSNKLLKSINIKGAQLRFQVSDLGLLWKANNVGVDPDYVPFQNVFVSNGGDGNLASRPAIRPRPVYNIGIKLNF